MSSSQTTMVAITSRWGSMPVLRARWAASLPLPERGRCGDLQHGGRAAGGSEAAWADRAAHADDLLVAIEEVEVEREAHAEGVYGGAAGDQEARAGRAAVE